MKAFGRAQRIGIVGGGLVLLASFALVLAGKIDAHEWLVFSSDFTWKWLAVILGAGAGIKMAKARQTDAGEGDAAP